MSTMSGSDDPKSEKRSSPGLQQSRKELQSKNCSTVTDAYVVNYENRAAQPILADARPSDAVENAQLDNVQPPDVEAQYRALIQSALARYNSQTGLLGIRSPNERDVLYGRGRLHREHPGNTHLRHLCDAYRTSYDQADRENKTRISQTIVNRTKTMGGRFLRYDKAQRLWFPVSGEEARLKVGHMIRDGRSYNRNEG